MMHCEEYSQFVSDLLKEGEYYISRGSRSEMCTSDMLVIQLKTNISL